MKPGKPLREPGVPGTWDIKMQRRISITRLCCTVPRMNRYRNWCFTMYVDPKDIDWDTTRNVRYVVHQHELCPETARDHWQGYIEFNKAVRMAEVKRILADRGVHLEQRRGTRAEARAYCMKTDTRFDADEEPFEWGDWTGADERKRTDLVAAKAEIQRCKTWSEVLANDEITNVVARHKNWAREVFDNRPIEADPPQINALYGWEEEAMEHLEGKPERRKILWIYSQESGTGKSTFFDYCSHRWNILPGTDYVNTLYAYDGHYAIWFDLTRSQYNDELAPYHALEKLSNGGFHLSNKYVTVRKYVSCHIVVTANGPPNTGKLPDRCTIIIANKEYRPPLTPPSSAESPLASETPEQLDASQDLLDSQ